MNRTEEIRRRLIAALAPTSLEVEDQSHLHAGHAGARQSGGGHFVVRIAAAAFAGKTPMQRHKMVYHALGDMLPAEIHALSIHAREKQR